MHTYTHGAISPQMKIPLNKDIVCHAELTLQGHLWFNTATSGTALLMQVFKYLRPKSFQTLQ
jgi:hypothetical protein